MLPVLGDSKTQNPFREWIFARKREFRGGYLSLDIFVANNPHFIAEFVPKRIE